MGRLVTEGGFWKLVPGDGRWLVDGEVIEAKASRGAPWSSWVVRFPGHPSGPTGLGPLSKAFARGAFTFTETEDHRWDGVLRAGTFESAHCSLELLKQILASDVVRSLASLRLHVAQRSGHLEWSSFIAAHRRLALGAPFRLLLCSPLEANGTEALVPLASEQVPGLSAYGTGTRWTVPQSTGERTWCLRNARIPISGWTTLEPGDWIDERVGGQLTARHQLTRAPSRISAPDPVTAASACVAVPAERWRQVPLEREGDLHILRLDGKVFRFAVSEDGIRALLPELSPGRLRSWFDWEHLDGRCVVFLPRPSPFLAGEVRSWPQADLSGLLSQLDAADAAFDALQALAAEDRRQLPLLLAPYCHAPGELQPGLGGFSSDDVELSGGVPTKLTLAPWLHFERDLPLLLMHPLLAHLRVLALRSTFLGSDRVAQLRARALALRPSLRVEAPILKFVSPRVV